MITSSIAAFLCYFAILLTIGLVSHHKQKSAKDFIVGNRSLNFWLTALSAHASDMSAWLFMGLPSATYLFGASQIWIPIGLVFGMYLNWTFVARKLRENTANTDSVTLSTYFERHFKDKGGSIRFLTAILTVVYLAAYLSAGLMAMGLLLESVFGMNYYAGLAIATCVALTYTFFGGFVTIAWTDLFQALFLLCVVAALPIWIFFRLDNGWTTITENAKQMEISLSILPDFSFKSLFGAVSLVLGWGIGYFGQPHIITKFMGIKNPSDLVKSKYVGMSWQIAALAGSLGLGLIGIGFFGPNLSNPELVTVDMVKELFHPFTGAFILCAILAANISTMDSQILVAGSVISEDLYLPWKKIHVKEKTLLRVSRIGVCLIAVVSLGIAFLKNSNVLNTVLWAWSGLGSSFGPLVLMSLYSKTANKKGAIAGIVTGGVVSAFWPLVNPHITTTPISPLFPGFLLSLIAIFTVSRLTRSYQT